MGKQLQLHNGLRIASKSIDGTAFVTLGAAIRAGVRFEVPYSAGISSLLREVSLKGTSKYASAQRIFGEIEGRGGSLRSGTNKVMTYYLLRIPASHSELGLDILCEMIWSPQLDSERIENARTLITGQLKATSDAPDKLVRAVIDRTMWHGHPLAHWRLGDVTTISRIGAKELLEFKESRYSLENVVFSLAGDTSHMDNVARMLSSYHASKHTPAEAKNLAVEPVPLMHAGPRVALESRTFGKTYIALGAPVVNDIRHLRYALSVLSLALGEGRGARLALEMVDKRSLAYKVLSEASFYGGMGDLVIHAVVDSKRLTDSLGFLLEEISKLAEHGITRAELSRAKALATNSFLNDMEDTGKAAYMLAQEELMADGVTKLEEVPSVLDSLTGSDIQQIVRDMLATDNLYLAVVGPFDNERELARLVERAPGW